MPVSYQIDRERSLVITTAWGVLTAAEAMEHQRRLSSDPEFRPEFCQLSNFLAVTDIELDGKAIKQLAQLNFFAPGSRRAAVATAAVSIGLLRMFETYREIAGGQEDFRIFGDPEEALRWLLPS
jgi:hypothetical protein